MVPQRQEDGQFAHRQELNGLRRELQVESPDVLEAEPADRIPEETDRSRILFDSDRRDSTEPDCDREVSDVASEIDGSTNLKPFQPRTDGFPPCGDADLAAGVSDAQPGKRLVIERWMTIELEAPAVDPAIKQPPQRCLRDASV